VARSYVNARTSWAGKTTVIYPMLLGKPAKSQYKGERNQVGLRDQEAYWLLATVTKTMDLPSRLLTWN